MGAGHSILLLGGTNMQIRSKLSSASIGRPSGRLQPCLSVQECENQDTCTPLSSSAAVLLHSAFLKDLQDLHEQLVRGEKLPEVGGKSTQWQSAEVSAVTPHWAVCLNYAAHMTRGSGG